MHPRTVKMAAEVASQFSTAQVGEYGNIIQNGYLEVVANTTNKKAWQYAETTTAPVNLPSLSEVTPVYKGWTTNYMSYYTQLPPNPYLQNPGNPTMFEYAVQGFTPYRGPIVSATYFTYGENYVPGSYTGVGTTGSLGGAFATVNFDVDAAGKPYNLVFATPGQGYLVGELLAVLDVGQGGTEPIIFHISEVEISSGGDPKWAMPPQRRKNSLFPMANYASAPPIDNLNI